MLRRSLLVFALFAVPLLALPVHTETVAAPVPTHLMPQEPPLFPTRVGTKWVYAAGASKYTHVITRVDRKDGASRITVSSTGPNEERIDFWSSRPDGLFLVEGARFFAGTDRASGESWCLMTTARPAGKWDVCGTNEGGVTDSGIFRVVAVEEIKVPAGTFTATKVEWAQSPLNHARHPVKTYWYVAGLGVVQVGDPPIWRLKSFELGK